MSFMEGQETGDHVTHDHPRKNTITYTYTWGKKGTRDIKIYWPMVKKQD